MCFIRNRYLKVFSFSFRSRLLAISSRSVVQDLEEWLVVDNYSQVVATQYEVPRFVKGIRYGESFALDWSVSGLGPAGESAAHENGQPV
jgi:hypothetical protein